MMPLTTIENVKSYLSITSEADDAVIARLVQACSEYVQSWLSRDLGMHEYTDIFDGTDGNTYMFSAYPVVNISNLKINNRDIPPAPDQTQSGYITLERKLALRGYYFTRGMMNCSVTYTAGFAEIPRDIEQAAIEMIAIRYRSRDRVGIVSKGLAGETIVFDQNDMPEFIKTKLYNYRKVIPS